MGNGNKLSKNEKFATRNFLIPIYVGVTGHRDIRDEFRTGVKQKVREFFKNKQKLCPDTPIILLSPLAEGADRIAVVAAIECNIDFIAMLPMPQEQYKNTFESIESINEFDSLISKASMVIELPLQNDIKIEDLTIPEKREDQYYFNGLLLARQCHYLIALWDGIETKKRGGTSEIVNFKKSGIPGKFEDNSNKLHQLQTGPIYHILTPRKCNPIPGNPLNTTIYYANYYSSDVNKAEKDEFEFYLRINTFNKDAKKLYYKFKNDVEINVNSLFTSNTDLSNKPGLSDLAYKHSIAGSLSEHFQKKRFRALKVLLSLVVLAFFFLHFNAEFLHSPYVLMLYPITIGIGAIWYVLSIKKGHEYKHEDYRALSEAYRIQFYLSAIGKGEFINEHFLKRHRGNLEWLRYALRTNEITQSIQNRNISGMESKELMKRILFLKTNWIYDQIKYFRGTASRYNILTKRYKLYANLFFVSSILAACLLCILSLKIGFILNNINFLEVLNPVLACGTSIFLVLAATFHGYSDKMIFEEQAMNYEQMAQLFNLAQEKLNSALEKEDENDAKIIILELAYEALNESGDWLLLHRSRPIEMPVG